MVLGGTLAFFLKLAKVGIKEPSIRFDDGFWFWRSVSFDFNEVFKEALDGPLCAVCERVFRSHRQSWCVVCLKKSSYKAGGDFSNLSDPLFDEEAVEQAASAQDAHGALRGITFGLELGGEAIEERPQRSAAE